jgi:hypothetical protein
VGSGDYMNYKGILGIILLIVTPFRLFKAPNTAYGIEVDLLFGLWWIFVLWLIWSIRTSYLFLDGAVSVLFILHA